MKLFFLTQPRLSRDTRMRSS